MFDETHEETQQILAERLGADGVISQAIRHEFAELSAEAERLLAELSKGNNVEVINGLFYIKMKCAALARSK